METFLSILWIVAGLYVAFGFLFAIALHARGLTTLDGGAKDASIVFRLLITPGLVALWPVMMRKWIAARGSKPHNGKVEAPYTPRTLRKFHGLLIMCLAVTLPILVGAALLFRQESHVTEIKSVLPEAQQTAEGDSQ